MAQEAFITFDLSPQSSEDYKTAYQVLVNGGFTVTTPPPGGVFLPNTTVMGTIDDTWTAVDLREAVKRAFRAAGLRMTSILCGLVSDWAAWGEAAE